MFDLDGWQEILSTLRRNKLRTVLTAVGVLWGIFILIVMLGAGNGLENGVNSSMSGFARNAVFVWGQRTSLPYAGLKPGRRVRFNNGDVDALRAGVPAIAHLAPRNQMGGFRAGSLVRRGTKTGSFTVSGDYPAIQHIQPIRLLEGRFLNQLDIDERRKVAVIGRPVKEQLFAAEEPAVGDAIAAGGVYFQVIGVFESPQGGERGERQAQVVHVPFTTFQQAFHQGDQVGFFALTADPSVGAAEIETQIKTVLAGRHRIAPADLQAIGTYNAQEDFQKMQNLFTGVRSIIWFSGVMTLLAGVIGVVNIMLISVKERTREIGVRKALGATQRSIVAMILRESVLLTSLAGCFGILAGVAVIELLADPSFASDTFQAPTVSFPATVAATIILIIAGGLAGILPARHAASIDPVRALRAE
ncbi:ABC transporter permease [Haliangium ochraceum]|uniref:ABC3 transporter permease protein domain-containing protein n=1 Tax=Haliangium ochraceum (strain DSM 14365 / JCM 11303 / SMP-2) TaxID=502025 RepID=D0LW89_HALO1|nr:ABC transporter permease [Haliangium ochraceum]ACY16021.1 protein of unknown function DUF214 [Haliangium ochraceum DSM 14365]